MNGNNIFRLFAIIILGVVAQQVLILLKQHNKKNAYVIARPIVLFYWIALGVIVIGEGITQLRQSDFLMGTAGMAFGLGLTLSGLGQTLERDWLKIVGVVVLSIGPIISGVTFVQSGSTLAGMIALSLGLGILFSALKGWPGGIGQIVIGAVILGSSMMLLISLLVKNTAQTDFANIAIGAATLLLGLWVGISGMITVISSIRQSAQATSPSVG